MRQAGIPETWIVKRFNDLQGGEGFLSQVNTIKQWDFKEPVSICLLSQLNGIGKTHISVCLLRKYFYLLLERHGKEAEKGSYKYFVKESEIYRRVQESYKDRSRETESAIINEFSSKNFLIIDDLFSSRDNEFARRIMLEIIDMRIDWKRIPTVITSNKSLEEIADIDPRIASRLTNGLVLNFKSGKDFRGI